MWRGRVGLRQSKLQSKYMLGDGKRESRSFAVLFAAAIAACGCHSGPSLEVYRVALKSSAGSTAIDCGVVMLSESKTNAVACANAALADHRPFFVAFQVQGIDSTIIHGLAVKATGEAVWSMWDSDAFGGSRRPFATKSWVKVEPCAKPSVAYADRPIKCS